MKYELNDAIPILGKLLEDGNLNIFVGSGISIDSGIPDWNGLVEEFLSMAKKIRFVDTTDKNEIHELIKVAQDRKKNNRFNPIEIATVIKNRLKISKEFRVPHSQAFKDYNGWISRTFDAKDANQKHKDIVSTDYKFILTSNYDDLLQKAAYDLGFIDFSANTYTYKQETAILKAINANISSTIHVHGIINNLDIEELVFTKEDYNKIILKNYSGFSFALRMLFTRYSTLFVGYGASDPHLEEVMEELSEYFPLIDDSFALPESYLVTLRDKADIILEKYKERVGTHLILIDDFKDYNYLLEELKKIKHRK